MNVRCLCLFICFFTAKFTFGQSSHSNGLHTDSLNYGGLERKYMYYIPAGIENSEKVPEVYFLHGMGASAQIGVNVLGPQYHARAERDKAIVVYPDATSKHWNDDT